MFVLELLQTACCGGSLVSVKDRLLCPSAKQLKQLQQPDSLAVLGRCKTGVALQVVQGDQTSKEPPFATIAADVWALGVIAYEVLCGKHTALLPSPQIYIKTLIVYIAACSNCVTHACCCIGPALLAS